MHRYEPRVTVSIKHMGTFQAVESRSFSETMFYAVTAYQNQKVVICILLANQISNEKLSILQVTQLKIKYNPFAKGFRGSELSSYPRSRYVYFMITFEFFVLLSSSVR